MPVSTRIDPRYRDQVLTLKGVDDESRDARGRWTPGSGSDDDGARRFGETDKSYAKRVVDKRDVPATLPEDHARYFNVGPDTKTIALTDLVSSKSAEENAQGGDNGAKRMAAAANGELSRRDPISAYEREDGKYVVTDGNGTLTSVGKYGWKALPVNVVPRPADKFFKEFNSDQPRDDHGRFASGGGSLVSGKDADTAVNQWKSGQPYKSVDEIRAAAAVNQGTLRQVAGPLAAANGTKFEDPGVKGPARIQEKIDQGKAVTDAVRGGFIVSTLDQSDKLVAGLAEKLNIADGGWRKTPDGYFDRQIKVLFSDGQVGEVQMWPPGMIEAKAIGHGIYEQARSLPADSPKLGPLVSQMRSLYAGVEKKLPPEWNLVFPP